MNTRQATRNWRIAQLKEMMRELGKKKRSLDYEKMIAFCSEEWGVARRTAREYIDTLVKGGFCKKLGLKIN